MIKTIQHKGLQRFALTGSKRGVQAGHVKRLRVLLNTLDGATVIGDIDQPGFRLHPLRTKSTRWSVRVSGNWRLTFEFTDGDVYLLDYEDYH